MRRWGASLALLGVAVGVSALLLEVVVLVGVGEQAKFPRRVVGAPFGVRINEPGARYRHKSADVDVEFRINSRGLRDDREHPYEKPPGRLRIVSLGDSFTAGYEVPVEETFSRVLEDRLRERGLDVEVLNAGVSGYSTAEEVLYLERELVKYNPDAILVSFFGNDLVDNVRTGLFLLDRGVLVEAADRYVPGGRVGNFLNTNPFFNWLSEYSNAFVFLKERATFLLKARMVRANEANLGAAEAGATSADGRDPGAHQRRLAAALFERLYAIARERGIPLVIQSIPSPNRGREPDRLLELFPSEEFDVARPGIVFFPAKRVLDPRLGRELLYHTRSHGHWTPLAHRLAGEGLADAISERAPFGPTP